MKTGTERNVRTFCDWLLKIAPFHSGFHPTTPSSLLLLMMLQPSPTATAIAVLASTVTEAQSAAMVIVVEMQMTQVFVHPFHCPQCTPSCKNNFYSLTFTASSPSLAIHLGLWLVISIVLA